MTHLAAGPTYATPNPDRDEAIALLREFAASIPTQEGECEGEWCIWCRKRIDPSSAHDESCLWLRSVAAVMAIDEHP